MPWRKGNRLKVLPEDQAQGRTAEIFDEIKGLLGVPHVGPMYEALAAYPVFLDLHWRAVLPLIRTKEFFDIAERLRADCYTRVHGYFAVPDLCSAPNNGFTPGARQELTQAIETCNYTDALFLLLAATQFQGFDSPVGQGIRGTPLRTPLATPEDLVVVTEENTPVPIRHVYEEIRHTLNLPFIPTAHAALARWPEFLHAYWHVLKPVIQSPVFEGCHYGVRETAFALVLEFPESIELTITQLAEAHTPDEDISSIVRIVELFVTALSGIMLSVAFAKIALEGGTGLAATVEKVQPEPAKPGDSERAA
jgi:hypothetical protein